MGRDPTTAGVRQAPAALARDAALARIGRTRRWMLAGAAALTAAFAALASVLLPGKSLGARTGVAAPTASRATTGSASGTPQLPAPAGPAELGLGSPDQAPQAAPSGSSPQGSPQGSAPQQAAPQPAPAPAPSSGVVSGGS